MDVVNFGSGVTGPPKKPGEETVEVEVEVEVEKKESPKGGKGDEKKKSKKKKEKEKKEKEKKEKGQYLNFACYGPHTVSYSMFFSSNPNN